MKLKKRGSKVKKERRYQGREMRKKTQITMWTGAVDAPVHNMNLKYEYSIINF